MIFYLKYPKYNYYWFFDDDVWASDWDKFMEGFEKDTSDFLAYYLFKSVGVTSQPRVPNVSPGMHSFQNPECTWFHRFPGHGDILPEDCKEMFGSFYAITRYSNRAMRELVNLNSAGFLGYSEGFVPTVLNRAGFSLGSIFSPDGTSPYFSGVEVTHKNIPITWSWL